MAMNTPYLGSSATVPGNLNTSYLSTGLTEVTSALSVWGPVTFLGTMPQFSTISASVGTFTSNVSIGGTLTVKSNISALGGLDASQTTQSKFLSYQTTASATSLILPDGAFGVYFESVTSCRLCFRSGVTTYTWIATTGAVL